MAFNLRLRFNGIFSVILLDFEHRRLWTDALRRRPTAGAVPANRATSMQCSDRADEDAVGGLGRWLAETGPQLGQTADSDEAGRGFRSEAGRRSDVKPATLPIGRRPGATASPRVVVDDPNCDGYGQVAGALCLRRLSPASSIRYAL